MRGAGAAGSPGTDGDQSQADQAKIGAFLFGLASLGDWRGGVADVNERGAVGHVQRHRTGVQPELVNHRQRHLLLDTRQSVRGGTACSAS